MKSTVMPLVGLLCAAVLGGTAAAQPILERVEQRVRDQVGSGQQPAAGTPQQNPIPGPGYLGVIADDRQEQGKGVRILSVVESGPAAQGGLQTGDLITAVDGKPVKEMPDMARALEGKAEGARVAFTVNRGGAMRDEKVTLGRRPASQPFGKIPENLPQPAGNQQPANPGPRLGVSTVPVQPQIAAEYGLADGNGAQVVNVTTGSPADRAGIPVGAVVRAVGNTPVNAPRDLANAIQARQKNEVDLTYVLRGQQITVQVSFAEPTPAADEPKLELRGRPVENPPAAQPGPLSPAADQAKIAVLEARIRELEQRLEKLEAILSEKK